MDGEVMARREGSSKKDKGRLKGIVTKNMN
jgi:hypothetical protein